MDHAGEIAALAAALLWSAGSIPFTYVARRAGATAVNAFKTNAAALILILYVCFTTGPGAFQQGDLGAWICISLSGVIGLSLSDSLLFRSYTLIGPRLAFLIFATNPFFAALLAWPVLGEAMHWTGVLGMTITVSGILLLTLGATSRAPDTEPHHRMEGMILAGLAALGMGVTSVLYMQGMVGDTMNAMTAHTVRMTAGALALLIVGVLTGSLRNWARGFRNRQVVSAASLGTLLGPVFGVWFFLQGLKWTGETGVAMALSSTTPVLVIPFTWVFHGDRPTLRAVIGAMVAAGGVVILFLRH